LPPTVATVFLRRMNDPANEYRRLDVIRDHSQFMLFESVVFASDPEAQRIALTDRDDESVIREQVRCEIDRLEREGFEVVSKMGSFL
jgi:hypothetical protein